LTADPRPVEPRITAARLLGVVRWVLPLWLSGVAAFFEWSEHIVREQGEYTPGFFGEIVLFAIIGPVAVFVTLAWVARLLRAYDVTSRALAGVNRGLEGKVAERTRHLEETTALLAAANTDLAMANAELLQLDRLKSEFVSLVSHQLRGPLTNIRGALEIVAGDATALPPASRRTLEILALETDRLSVLIMSILDVSRIEAGRLSPRLGPVALEPLLVRVCSASLGPERGRRWVLAVEPGLPPAWADETLLEEVVRNLLENAAHYAPEDSRIEVAALQRNDRTEITVTDRGPGVPAEEQALIFESFHRIGDDDTTVRGYGLGLYFADRLLRAMGGTVRVESPAWPDRPDAPGSRFVVSLMVSDDAPAGLDEGPQDTIGEAP
jgi:signal transduction histidine kinase